MFGVMNKTQLKLHIGMRYKGVTQRCCPGLLLCRDNENVSEKQLNAF